MMRKKEQLIPMSTKEVEYMKKHHPELIWDTKRRHRNINVENKPKNGFRFTGTGPSMSEDECNDADRAIDAALFKYAYEYNRLPDGVSRDERKRIESRLKSGIEGLYLVGDFKSVSILEKHLNNLSEYAVVKNDVLASVRKSMKYDCHRLGVSLFDKIANEMLEYFKDEAPEWNKKTTISDNEKLQYIPLVKRD